MEFTGILTKVGQREGDGQNGHWVIASYLVQTVEQYPKRLLVDVRNGQYDRVAYWDTFIGKNVTVKFDPDASEWNGRWYGRNNAYGIQEVSMAPVKTAADTAEVTQSQPAAQPTAATGQSPFPPITKEQDPTAQQPGEARSDDLPF